MREPVPFGNQRIARAGANELNGGCPERRAAALSALAEMDAPHIGSDPQEVCIRASAEGMATVARAVQMLEAALSRTEG